MVRRDVMNGLEAALEGRAAGGWRGARHVRVDGSCDPIDRTNAVRRFRDDPDIVVALLSITAAGTVSAHAQSLCAAKMIAGFLSLLSSLGQGRRAFQCRFLAFLRRHKGLDCISWLQ